LKHSDTGKKKRRTSKKALTGGQKLVKRERGEAPAASGDRKPAAAKPVVASRQEPRPSGADTAAAQMLYERAVKAYRQDDCRTALDLLERFLTAYPASPQAADVSLYKADCYLKLSGK
jgi:TolA-binding protein